MQTARGYTPEVSNKYSNGTERFHPRERLENIRTKRKGAFYLEPTE